MTEVQRLLHESGLPADQGTVVLTCMLESRIVDKSSLTKQEEVVITRINRLHDYLDQLEDWACGKERLLANVFEIFNE